MPSQSVQFTTPQWLSIVWTVNGCLTIVTLIFGFYLIWFRSTKEMSFYRHLLNPILLYSSGFDIVMNFVFRPVALFPLWGGFTESALAQFTGRVMAFLGILDGDATYLVPLIHLLCGVTLVSLVCGFLFRYLVLQTDSWFLRSTKRFYAIGSIIYTSTAFPISFLFAMARSSRKDMVEYILEVHPEYSELVNQTMWVIYDSAIGNPWSLIFGYAVVWNTLVYIVTIAITIYLIVTKMNSMKASMSERTYKLHRNLLTALCWQAAAPVALYFLPIFVAFVVIYLEQEHVQELMNVVCVLLGMHSIANVILMTYFTKPYREFTIELLKRMKIIRPNPESIVQPVSNVATDSSF